jgi:hypothetical protein
VKKASGPTGGWPTDECYLSRKPAIFITAKSETAEATDITIKIIERFDTYERGVDGLAVQPDQGAPPLHVRHGDRLALHLLHDR